MRNESLVRWVRSAGVVGVALAMGAGALASPVHAASKSERQSAQKKLIRHWQNSFRALKTLDCRWQMKGNFVYQPSVQHTYDYRFLWDSPRFRLDTAFSSTKPKERGDYQSTVHVFDGTFYRNLNTLVSGSQIFSLQPKPVQPVSPYEALLPIINAFIFVFDGEKFPFTLETLQNDAVWQSFEKRIQRIERGTWQKRQGFWLVVSGNPKEQRQLKVFVDDENGFPMFFSGRGRTQNKGKDSYSDDAFDFQVTQTMKWRSGSKTYLFPIKSIMRGWSKKVSGGSTTRTQTQVIEEATAPVKINQPMDATRLSFEIPAQTLVYFTPKPNTSYEDVYPFNYDSDGGSLWVQEKRMRERVVAAKKRIAALPKIYDVKADGKTQIESALVQARAENKRVLLQFGANWCAPCHVLHDVLRNDETIATILQKEYVTIAIDVDNKHNFGLFEQYQKQSKQQEGIPYVVVLDSDGKRLASPASSVLTTSNKYDAQKIAAFLLSCLPQ